MGAPQHATHSCIVFATSRLLPSLGGKTHPCAIAAGSNGHTTLVTKQLCSCQRDYRRGAWHAGGRPAQCGGSDQRHRRDPAHQPSHAEALWVRRRFAAELSIIRQLLQGPLFSSMHSIDMHALDRRRSQGRRPFMLVTCCTARFIYGTYHNSSNTGGTRHGILY